MEMYEETIYVEDAIKMVEISFDKQGASFSTRRRYQSVFRSLASFSNEYFHGEYTPEIGETFLWINEQRVPKFLAQTTFKTYVKAIQRANHVIEGDFDWMPSKPSLEYAKSRFDKIVKDYAEYLRNSRKTNSDVRARIHIIARFLQYIDRQNIAELNEITPQHIYSAFQSATDKGGFRKSIYSFLQYAYRYKLIPANFSLIVPTVKRHIPVPSIYSMDEICSLLNSIDCSTNIGKRNYAIILIAARLGLRSCDIAALTLENVDFEKNTIEITQLKTGEPQILPLLDEIKVALIDYINNARPKSESRHIFLKAILPLGQPMNPHGIYTIVSKQFEIAGVLQKGRRRGPHALRASLATSLLDEGNEYSVIQEVLGHTSKTAAKSYVKIDIAHLRSFALEVPEPGGNFKRLLADGGAAYEEIYI